MDDILVLIAIGALLTLVIGSVMGFVANSRVSRLEREIKGLRNELFLRRKYEEVPSVKAAKPTPLKAAPPKVQKPTPKAAIKADVKDGTGPRAPISYPAVDKPEKIKKPGKPKRSFEEMIGAQWSVWVGGLALLLGAIFILRYTIEAGVFTPKMRVLMAAVFGAGLLGGGEYLRRAETKAKIPQSLANTLSANAYIPGVLTAVGIFALLGAVYAAFAMFGFIGAPFALILMGAVSVGALALGLIHGPKLAALGLVASLVAPLVIQTDQPNAYGLYAYLSIVSLAALALADKRRWGWLNLATLFGAMFWIWFSMGAAKGGGTHIAWLSFCGLMFAISTFVANRTDTASPRGASPKWVYNAAAAIIWGVLCAFALWSAADLHGFGRVHYFAGLGFAAILLAVARLLPKQSYHIITAGLLGVIFIIASHSNAIYLWQESAAMAGLFCGVLIAMCYWRQTAQIKGIDDQAVNVVWAFAAVLIPTGIFSSFFLNYSAAPDTIIALALVVLSLVYALLAYRLSGAKPQLDHAISVYALGAGLAYIAAALIKLEPMGETLAFIGGIALAGLAALKLPIAANRMMAAGFGLLTAAHVLFFQIPNPDAIRETIIFNQLWIYFALPALVCAGFAVLLSRQNRDLWVEGLKALVLTFTALFFVFQIRHIMNGGNVLADRLSLDELSLQVIVGLCFTLGGSLIGPQTMDKSAPIDARLVPILAIGVSLLTIFVFVIGVCFAKAPLLNTAITIRGGFIINSLLLAYLVPAILLGLIAWLGRGRRPRLYLRLIAGLSLFAFMIYVTSMIRMGFNGASIALAKTPPVDLELYTISAVWLIIGIALLVIGLRGKRQDIRMASGLIIILTVLKAFLIDMASLEGMLRAVSFMVLGLVLIVIGRVYQRILFSKTADD